MKRKQMTISLKLNYIKAERKRKLKIYFIHAHSNELNIFISINIHTTLINGCKIELSIGEWLAVNRNILLFSGDLLQAQSRLYLKSYQKCSHQNRDRDLGQYLGGRRISEVSGNLECCHIWFGPH